MAKDCQQDRDDVVEKTKSLLEVMMTLLVWRWQQQSDRARSLCAQFYFGDSNLLKDRFLKEAIEKDDLGLVPIEVLKTFNKLKVLTDGNEETIRDAAKTSKELRVSEDGKRIGRLKPLPRLDDTRPRTIYVEGIAPSSTHEEISSFMSKWGKVCYVSLPRFKDQDGNPGKTKGFCFVEFEHVEEAKKAVGSIKEEQQKLSKDCESFLKALEKEEWERSKLEYRKQQQQQHLEETRPHRLFDPGLVLRFSGIGVTPTSSKVKETFEAFAPIKAWDVTTISEKGAGEQKFFGNVRFDDAKGARIGNNAWDLVRLKLSVRVTMML
ncbi:hypothetical protein GUITHDRAFT_114292 [Guillardia theta CCMP2712]|uniref:RRM domain-containing protein n=1 Tax=Guillardia theta (strain CCMP2712) TaxID=905079 RepID=L1IUI7_GUITC|nr:hypothetical protein GUITHDRAFT_114292 [Guillardia theta CCMP2712]EKX39564.1 hypothetical protein GUITHDRAFT_114292 [Guillardia theta CCMP2712]|eukprot:XP_005826544.1 hypothetical protein GUITHDRAFT_114292 [Guillardia theta CCMP2712]